MRYTIKLVAILALTIIGCQAQISFVQVAESTPQTPQSSVSVSYSQSQTAGDLNIVVVGWNDTTATVQSVTDTQGNTYTLATGPLKGTGLTQSIYYAKNIRGGSNSVTATFSQAAVFPDIRITEYKGLSTTSPLDKVVGAAGTSGNNASVSSGSSGTTTSTNELIFGSAITTGAFTTAGTGFTKEVIDSDGNIVEDETVTSTGSYATTATLGAFGSQNWIMQMATFVGSSGGGSAPTVISISPNSGTTAGATPVTITGTGFISGSTVTIGGAAATGVTVVSSTSITATTPAGSAGAATVVVSNSNGSGQLTNGFTYTSGSGSIGFVQVAESTPQTPQSSVSVSYSQSQTAGDLNIVVVGWNDTTATVQSVTDTQGNTYTLATGPLKGTGLTQSIYYAKNIRGGSNSVTATFSQAAVFPDIRITEYKGLSTTSPLDKVVGAAGTSGNNASVSSGSSGTTTSTNELIFGSAITTGAFTTAGTGFTKEVIDSDGNIVEDETVTSTGSYATTATLGAFGSQNWIMQMATFVGSSGGGSAPTVISISPNSGTTAGATPVTITGTGFISGSTVTIGGAAATGVTVVSSTSITATTPAGSAGAATVVVSNSNGSGQLTNGFTYTAAPTITQMSPSQGFVGNAVTITGTNFGVAQGGSAITVNGTPANSIIWSSTSIVVSVPAGATSGSVLVTINGVQLNAGSFTVTSSFPVTASAFGYDAMGRVKYDWTCTPLNCGENFNPSHIQNTYDVGGDLTNTYNGYTTVDYTIGAAGEVTQVSDNFGTLAQGPGGAGPIAYAPHGAVSAMSMGNGLSQSFVYNIRFQPCRSNLNSSGSVLSSCSSAVPGGNVQDFSYNFNLGTDNGNLSNFVAVGISLGQNFNRTYSYDALNRLQTMSAPGDVCSGLSWVIDPWGNRTQQNNGGGTCFQPQLPVNSQNQLMGSPYQYDAAGNLTYDGNHHYTYDAENRIVEVDPATGNATIYVYDASGDRVEKQLPGNGEISDYLYDGGQVASRWTNQTQDDSYVYLDGQPLVHYYSPSMNLAYMQTDNLGSTRLELDSTQAVVQCADFYPYGELNPCGKSQFMLKEFTGKERDSESGLDNFGARYDASSMGRFMTPDPLMASAKVWDPQTWNRYAYALNNPLKYVDPTGMNEVTAAQCAQDKNCVTVNVNVIYDKNANDGKGLTDKQKSDFEKGQLQSAKDQYGNADIHLNVSYTAGALSTDNGKTTVSGLQAGALNVVVTDQVGTAVSGMAGKTAVSFINPNSNDLPHEMAHQFMGDTQGWRNWVMNHDPIITGTILNAITDIGNDTERAWMRNIDQHSGPLSYYPLASAFHHNAAVFQRSIQPTTKPQQ